MDKKDNAMEYAYNYLDKLAAINSYQDTEIVGAAKEGLTLKNYQWN